MNSGIYTLPEADYHADPSPEASLSASVAKILLAQSPLHAWLSHPKLNPNYRPDESSRFDIGSIAHALLLEPEAAKIAVVDADDWRTKAAKEQRDEARANGLIPMLARQEYSVRKMAEVARAFLEGSELKGIMSRGKPEQTLIWQEVNGVWCRSRLDWLTDKGDIILDYKTTENAEPDACGRRLMQMDYHLQAAFYLRGVKVLTKSDPTFVFLFQEIESPFACSLVGLSNSLLEMAEARYYRALALWERCLKANDWPGYPNQICYIEPPSWALNQHIQQMEAEFQKDIES